MDQSFKKSLATLFNETNKEIFHVGVHEQKIEIVGNKILILARTQRIPALDALGDEHSGLVLALDAALSSRYKTLLKEKLEDMFDLKITSLFRDYDPNKGISCTVICLENQITK
ncbi:Na-translocating system protein MpsC family protein [Bacillus sp. 03113]|uniref:Na-translocating system protein MpsC family protein n=1 Tax=Bacillus sp. 03113 TaxID=2578211 RepID=UPI00114474A1|nr:Na-translocating system protein MpsC family protein [Bacillus sp. 03113]